MNIITLLDMVASVDPDRVAVGGLSDGLTLGDLRAAADRGATVLQDLPARPLIFAGTSSRAFPVALFAAAVAERPFTPISYRLAAAPFADLVGDQLPATLVAAERTSANLPDLVGLELFTPESFLERVNGTQTSVSEPGHDPEGPAVLLHTSGTTGKPKVAVLRHRHLTSYVLNGTQMLAAGREEAALVSVPPYHIAGVAGILTGIYGGRRIVQLPDFSAPSWVELALKERITHAMVVPTMLSRIVEVLERDDIELPDLRHVSYGGGRMPRAVIEHALTLLPHVDFVNGYGLTETTSSIAVLGPEDHRQAITATDPEVRRRLESVGRPLPGVEISVRDLLGDPAPDGEKGVLWVRGPQVSGEYTSSTPLDADGWFNTHDAGWIDAEGYVYVEGRLDDVIIRGGENLSPGEIENALLEHPKIAETAVYGRPDEEWGEVVVAVVVPRDGAALSEEEVKDWVASRLRSSRVPAVVRFLAELPRNDMGKVLRRVLRAET